jgi:hypothetical protein
MERRGAVLAMVSLAFVSACSMGSAPASQASSYEPAAAAVASAAQGGAGTTLAGAGGTKDDLERAERRIIRSAHLGIVASDVAGAERRAGAIVEELGGYVASSDRSVPAIDDEPAEPQVSMVLRVPSDRFTAALSGLQELGSRVVTQRVHANDVTEEFIDLKARLVAQRALEVQFLEILKQARSVKDALEVHTQLADVRTTIEKVEGRQRYLESQTSISTIELGIAHRAPLVRASRFEFAGSIERAGADLLNVSAVILHGAIRLIGFFTPIFAFVVLPALVVARAFLRRRRQRLASA